MSWPDYDKMEVRLHSTRNSGPDNDIFTDLQKRMGGLLAKRQSFRVPAALAQNFRMDGSPGRDAELVELVQQFVNVRCIGVKWTDATGEGVFSGTMLSESGTSVCLRITVILDTAAGELLVSSTDAMLVSAN